MIWGRSDARHNVARAMRHKTRVISSPGARDDCNPKSIAEEEARQLQKKIQTIENDLDQTQEGLMQVNAKLEEKEKALQNGVPRPPRVRAAVIFGDPRLIWDRCPVFR
ncbi:Tropomyosin-2 [Papilio machaon]|uniref:Tropomyosin-2 n=1 Tax=Papilio machaon TaxID=76193 RepID=A0A194RJV4_PAPMA|nr:Tropomyosin-2 [Papilio machaon]